MTDAKTLVARLRAEAATWEIGIPGCESAVGRVLLDAAAAIEELTAVLHRVDAHFAGTDAPLGIRARALLTKYGASNG